MLIVSEKVKAKARARGAKTLVRHANSFINLGVELCPS
jgi:hypothetical protein